MASWTLNGIPVDQFARVERAIANQTAGALTLARHARADAAPLFAYGAEVLLRDPAGHVRFRGRVRVPSDGAETGRSAVQQSLVADGWQALEDRIYLVDWPFDTSSAKTTRYVIGGHYEEIDVSDPLADPPSPQLVLDLVPDDVAASLAAALGFAGYGPDAREIGVGGIIPPIAGDNTSVAGIIKAAARWFPGAVAWVDATDAGDVFRLRRASTMASLDIDIAPLAGDALRVRARPDLVVPGVRLGMRKIVRAEGGNAREDLTVVTAGDSTAPGALVEDIDLMPEIHVLEIANLKISEELNSSAVNDLDWWAERVEWIKTAIADGDIYQGKFSELTIFNGQVRRDYQSFGGSLPNIIVKGTVPESFKLRGCDGPFAPGDKVVTSQNTIKPRFGRATASAKCQVIHENGFVTVEDLSIDLILTDLPPGTARYACEDPLGYDPGEDPSLFSGLPAAIMAETARLGYDVELTLKTDELPEGLMGRALNLTGGSDPAWATMRAPIHAVSQDVHTRETRLRAGPASYLGIKDLISLIRTAKHTRPKFRRLSTGGLPPFTMPSQNANEEEPPDDPPGSGPSQPAPNVQSGRLKATITPDGAVSAGATYSAVRKGGAGVGPFQSDEEADVEAGTYTIHFAAVSGFIPPPKVEDVQVGAGQLETIPENECVYSPASGINLPFVFEIRAKADTPGAYEGRVAPGELRKSRRADDLATIANLGSWASISSFPTLAWIRVDFDREGNLTAAKIDGDGGTDTFETTAEAWATNSYCEDDGDEEEPLHKITRLLIARITRTGDGPPVVDQRVIGHLSIMDGIVDGRPAQVLECV